jgi:hypothetical protein
MFLRFTSASQNLRPIIPAAPVTRMFIPRSMDCTMNDWPALHKKTIAGESAHR